MGKRQSLEFKLNAVNKALQRRGEQTLESVATELGIGYSTLTRWMSQVTTGKLTAPSVPSASPSRRPEDWSPQKHGTPTHC